MSVPRRPNMHEPEQREPLLKVALAYADNVGVKLTEKREPDGEWFMKQNAFNQECMDAVGPRLQDFDETRLQAMKESGIYCVVNSFVCPGIERIVDEKEAQEAAAASNDILASKIKAHPDNFGGLPTFVWAQVRDAGRTQRTDVEGTAIMTYGDEPPVLEPADHGAQVIAHRAGQRVRWRNIPLLIAARRAVVMASCLLGVLWSTLTANTTAIVSAEPTLIVDCGPAGHDPDGRSLRLVITAGKPDCARAASVLADYRASTDKQGSGGFATVDGWDCGHASVAGIEPSLTVDECDNDGDAFSTQIRSN